VLGQFEAAWRLEVECYGHLRCGRLRYGRLRYGHLLRSTQQPIRNTQHESLEVKCQRDPLIRGKVLETD